MEWPRPAAGELRTFTICVLRDPAFAELIRGKVAGLNVRGLPVEVQSLDKAEAARACQVLFIARTSRSELEAALAVVADLPVLTVGSQPGFLEAGGMINLVRHEDTIRFTVNLVAPQRIGLAFDARLLQAAYEVGR